VSVSGLGDPEGRRLARRRALVLSEAGRLADLLAILLERAQLSVDECQALCRDLATKERIEWQRADGHIEPRTRFPTLGSHPLLLDLPLNVLSIDECGIPHPGSSSRQPVFTLAGIAFDVEDIDNYRAAADELKLDFFGTTAFTFHEPDLRNHVGPYYFGGNVKRQKQFDDRMAGLITTTRFVAFGAAVRKDAFRDLFIETGADPYLPVEVYCLAITLLMERYIDFLAMSGNRRRGRVIFESQGPAEDALHQRDYANLLVNGTQWVGERSFQQWLEPGVTFRFKRGSDPTELSDLFARDLYEWANSECAAIPKWWSLFSRKIFARDDGQKGKFGVKLFPDEGVRERVEAHRQEVLRAIKSA
jgi:hypothetical protein